MISRAKKTINVSEKNEYTEDFSSSLFTRPTIAFEEINFLGELARHIMYFESKIKKKAPMAKIIDQTTAAT